MNAVQPPQAMRICGSLHFQDLFLAERPRLTTLSVIALCRESISDELTSARRAAVAELHLRRIDLADEVRVVSKGGYIGSATKRQIEHARKNWKIISAVGPGLSL